MINLHFLKNVLLTIARLQIDNECIHSTSKIQYSIKDASCGTNVPKRDMWVNFSKQGRFENTSKRTYGITIPVIFG